jgi:deazaflavin-dependent oxidoreductase (nitroreductase family)
VLRPLIRLQRAVINPRQMRSAGQPGAYAAVIRHRGRTSGRPYETPVGAVAVDDGFVIALVYGSRTQWLRNVLANGSATIVHEGRAYAVDQPEVVPMQEVATHFAAGDQRGFRWLGVDEALRVRRVETGASFAGFGSLDQVVGDHDKAQDRRRSVAARATSK